MTLSMMKKKNLTVSEQTSNDHEWNTFVKVVVAHIDPVLASIFYATQLVQFEKSQKIIRISTLKKFVLFQDLFIEQKKFYQEYLDRIFGFGSTLVVDFSLIDQPKKREVVVDVSVEKKDDILEKNNIKTSHVSAINKSKIGEYTPQKNMKNVSIDISDKAKWKVTHALLEHFGGTVREIIKDTYESNT